MDIKAVNNAIELDTSNGIGMTDNLKDLLAHQQTQCEFITEVYAELNVVTSVALFNTKSLTRNCHL